MRTTDTLIIGKGPAGTQAAIYIKRAGFNPTVVGYGDGSLALASKIENYYGMDASAPVSGIELHKRGEAQLRGLGIDVVDDQVVGLEFASAGNDGDGSGFSVRTPGIEIFAKALLIATGKKRVQAAVDGLETFEGKGVSYCSICDGFFYRGKRVGVLGYTGYALHEAAELARICDSVTIFTNGEPMQYEGGVSPKDYGLYETVTERIDAVLGGERLTGLRLSNGGIRGIDGLFVAYGTAGSKDLAQKLGILTNTAGDILTDAAQETNVPGVFAAGDCTGGLAQVSVAVGQGAVAARSIIKLLTGH